MSDFHRLIETSDDLYRSSSSLFHAGLLSTLWIGNREETPINTITIHETQADLLLKIYISDLRSFNLNLQITPETVLIQGQPSKEAIVEGYFRPNGFESLIPLTRPVQPETSLTEIQPDSVLIQIAKELTIPQAKVQINIPGMSHTPMKI